MKYLIAYPADDPKKAAVTTGETHDDLPEHYCGFEVETEADLARVAGTVLVALFNRRLAPDDPTRVKRFENSRVAARRVFPLLERLAVHHEPKPAIEVGEAADAAPVPEPKPRRRATKATEPKPPREVRQAQLVAELSGPDGASIEDLTEKFGWLPHTARAAISMLRKARFEITSEKVNGRGRVYRSSAEPLGIVPNPED